MNTKLILLSLAFLVALVIVAASMGAYNVAATDKHWGVTSSLIGWVRERSIEARSEGIKVPDLSGDDMVTMGAREYDEVCTACHLKPGQAATELAQGLYPHAPVFYKFQRTDTGGLDDSEAAELFWVIKNGLKMTGMPAWGLTHNDKRIWSLTGFIGKLPGMTAEDYSRWVERAGEDEHAQGGHEDIHAHENAG